MTVAIYDVSPAFVGIAQASSITNDYIEFNPRRPWDGARHIIQARVVVTSEKVVVLTRRPDVDGPYLAYSEEIVDFVKAPRQSGVSYVKTKNGELLAFTKDSGCGCGSTLKSISTARYL